MYHSKLVEVLMPITLTPALHHMLLAEERGGGGRVHCFNTLKENL